MFKEVTKYQTADYLSCRIAHTWPHVYVGVFIIDDFGDSVVIADPTVWYYSLNLGV